MGRFLNPDNSAFQVALNSEIYVDKTKLLEYTNRVLCSNQAMICNSRPRRFGKSITANMLVAYYSKGCDSEKMFADLQISKSASFKKHLNQYDVIYIDVQWCMLDAGAAEQTVKYINEHIIKELHDAYKDIPLSDVQNAYSALMRINLATGKRFVVIIDEWDVLIRDEAMNQEIQEEYISFLRGLFKGADPTKFLALAYLTGILPIKKYKTQSALNNFDEFTMLDSSILAPYIGFTEDEVKSLCVKYDKDFAEVKRWYDGYQLGKYHVYNPRAVVSVMLRGSFQSYWSQTGTYESILPLINMDFDGLRAAIVDMLAGDSVEVNPYFFQNDMVSFKDKNDVLTLLIHLGYLAYDEIRRKAFIPNEEIRFEFAMATKLNKWNDLQQFQIKSCELLDYVLEENSAAVAAAVEDIHNHYASVIQYNDENSLSSVLCIAFLATLEYYFKPIRELPTGRGFADFVYLPKTEYNADYPALLVELKWNKNAESALKQIKEKKYPLSLQNFTNNILLVGISYDKKSKKHECIIEKFQPAEKHTKEQENDNDDNFNK